MYYKVLCRKKVNESVNTYDSWVVAQSENEAINKVVSRELERAVADPGKLKELYYYKQRFGITTKAGDEISFSIDGVKKMNGGQ